jgi:hypothetical protein
MFDILCSSIIPCDRNTVSFGNPPRISQKHAWWDSTSLISFLGQEIEEELDKAAYDPENMKPDGSTDTGSIISRKMLVAAV